MVLIYNLTKNFKAWDQSAMLTTHGFDTSQAHRFWQTDLISNVIMLYAFRIKRYACLGTAFDDIKGSFQIRFIVRSMIL
jgi:hypothetical protein